MSRCGRRRSANVPYTNSFPSTTRFSTSAARQATPEIDEAEFASVHPPTSPVTQSDAPPFDWTKWTTKWGLDDGFNVETPKKNAGVAGNVNSISPFKVPAFSPLPESSWLRNIFDSSGNLRDLPPTPSPLKVADSVARNKRARPEADEDDESEEEDEVENKLKRMRIGKSTDKRAFGTDDDGAQSVATQDETSGSASTGPAATLSLEADTQGSGSSSDLATQTEEHEAELTASVDVAPDAVDLAGGDNGVEEEEHVESATTSSASASPSTPSSNSSTPSGSPDSLTIALEAVDGPSTAGFDDAPEVIDLTGNDDNDNAGDPEHDDRVFLSDPWANSVNATLEGSESSASTATSSSSASSASTPFTTPSTECSEQGSLEAGSLESRAGSTESAGVQGSIGDVAQASGSFNTDSGAPLIDNSASVVSTITYAQSIPVTQFASNPYLGPYPVPYDPLPPQYIPPNVGPQVQMPYAFHPQMYPVGYHYPQVPPHLSAYYAPSSGVYPSYPVQGHYVQAQQPALPYQQYPAPPFSQYPAQQNPVMAYQQPIHVAAQPTQPTLPAPQAQQGDTNVSLPAPQPTRAARAPKNSTRGWEVKVLKEDGTMQIAGWNNRPASAKIPDYARGSSAKDSTAVKDKAKSDGGGARQVSNAAGRGRGAGGRGRGRGRGAPK